MHWVSAPRIVVPDCIVPLQKWWLSTMHIFIAYDHMGTHAHITIQSLLHHIKLNWHSFMVKFSATRPWSRTFLEHSRVKTGLLQVTWIEMMRIHNRDMTHSSVCHNTCGPTFISVTWLVQSDTNNVSHQIKQATFPVYVVFPRWSCIAPPQHASLSSSVKSASSSWSSDSNA